MVSKITAADITPNVTTGNLAANLINDLKARLNQIIEDLPTLDSYVGNVPTNDVVLTVNDSGNRQWKNIEDVLTGQILESLLDSHLGTSWKTGGGGGEVNNLPVISGPVVLGDTDKNVVKSFTTSQLLSNASDVDIGDTVSLFNTPTVDRGSIQAVGPDGWEVTPPTDYIGKIIVSYKVTDSKVAVDATAEIEVVNTSSPIYGTVIDITGVGVD